MLYALKNILKYGISLGIAVLLLWYVYRDLDISAMLAKLGRADYFWIVLSVLVSLVSHVARAYRWNLLLKPLGYRHLTIFRTLLAVMIGYFANLIIPRMGEVSRCGLLKRTDDIPITTSLGSVVAERIVDLCSLLLITALLFVIEFSRLKGFLLSFFNDSINRIGQHVFAIYLLAGLFFLAIIAFFFLGRILRQRFKHNHTFNKLKQFAREVARGISSLGNVENKPGFWGATVIIWFFYFLMSYLVFFSLPETSFLGWRAGLAVLVMGALGMSAPVQGGIGTFHALVSSVLLLYGLSEADGVLFATLVHGIQTLSFVVFGGVSFFIASVIASRKPAAAQKVEVKN